MLARHRAGGRRLSDEPSPPAPASASSEVGGDAYLASAYRAHWATICRYVAHRFGPGPPEPEEAAQAAFARYAALPDHGVVKNVPGFLTRCAHNFVIDARRRQAVSAEFARESVALANDMTSHAIDSHRLLEGRQRLAAIETAIAGMEEKRRKVLILHSIHELSYAEIARHLRLSPTRVVQLFADAIAICTQAARDHDGEEWH